MKRAIATALAGALLLSCAELKSNIDRSLSGRPGGGSSLSPSLANAPDALKSLGGAKSCTPAQRREFELTAENEYWFGRSVAARVLARYSGDKVYEPTSAAALYVNEVGQAAVVGAIGLQDTGTSDASNPRRFATQARIEDTPDRPLPVNGYHFILVRDPAPNAWGLPGGFVIVTDGLVARSGTEDQLAGVLAHEIAHVQRGHGVEIMKDSLCRQRDSVLGYLKKQGQASLGGSSFFAALPLEKGLELLDQGAERLVQTVTADGYGREYEFEADAFGTRYLAASGYSPSALGDMLTRIADDSALKAAQTRSHPLPKERVEKITALLTAERLDPAHSPHEPERNVRFVQTMVESGLRPDWQDQLPKPKAAAPKKKKTS